MEGPEEEAVLRALLSMDSEASSRSARATSLFHRLHEEAALLARRKRKMRVAAAHHLTSTVPLFWNSSVVI